MFSDSEFFYSNKYLKYLVGKNIKNVNQKNINQLIILTTPHETCIDHINHYCDYYANKLAMTLKHIFLFKKYNIKILHGNINRTRIDLNRIQSRNTQFRKKLREIVDNFNIKTDSHNIIYIIDCHSFPFEKNGNTFSTNDVKNPQTTILYDTDIEEKYANILKTILQKKNIDVTNLPGIHNDIIDEFSNIHKHNLHIIPILIEVREDLTDIQLNDIADSINEWIIIINENLFGK